jgi:hypothetical protein
MSAETKRGPLRTIQLMRVSVELNQSPFDLREVEALEAVVREHFRLVDALAATYRGLPTTGEGAAFLRGIYASAGMEVPS